MGRYCRYLLPNQAPATPIEKHKKMANEWMDNGVHEPNEAPFCLRHGLDGLAEERAHHLPRSHRHFDQDGRQSVVPVIVLFLKFSR